jgi:hypothetical protein
MRDCQGRASSGEHRHNRDSVTAQPDHAGGKTTGESSEPAQAAAGKEQVDERSLWTGVLDCPHELRAGKTADDAGYSRVHGGVWQPRPSALAIEEPEACQGGQGHEHTEAGDFELADAKQDWVNRDLPSPAESVAPMAGTRYRAK